jgi:DUF4097 and DUF4098 domain-containing protein YvlB
VEDFMTKRDFVLSAVALLAAVPALSQNYGAQTCADMHMDFGNRLTVRSEQTLTFPASEAPKLTYAEERNGGIKVVGTDSNEYSVLACKSATADTDAEAKQILEKIQVSRQGGSLQVTGPDTDNDRQWNVMLIVRAPKNSGLDLSVHNGPMSVREMAGGGTLRAQNGPISLRDSSGQFAVETRNGPISYSGHGGNVKLNAHNGPIQVDVASEQWNGELSGEAVNGPIELLLPAKFSAGVEVENYNAPMSCNADICHEGVRMDGHHMSLGGSNPVIHLSTQHGPITVQNRKKL